MRTFKIRYEFTSTRADGDEYFRTIEVQARSVAGALTIARIEGFRAFGARFNDNCTDWQVVE